MGVSTYKYFLKDHLGNVRVTLTSKVESHTYRATMESELAPVEEQLFGNVAATRQTDLAYDHTHLAYGFGNRSSRLNVNEGKVVGPTLSLYINAGDTIKAKAYAKYTGIPGSGGTPFSMAGEVTGGFGLSAGGETATAYAALSNLLVDGSAFLGFSGNPDLPKAYLTYHYFDAKHHYLTSGFVHVSEGANGNFEELALEFTADQQGYVYLYVANETMADFNVFFDDVEVQHSYGPVVQKDDFYPGGATFHEYRRSASVENRYKFQGHEWIPELLHYDLGPRGWDPHTWRTNAQDLLADQFPDQSPYSLFRNNPMRFTDPTGMYSTEE